MLRLFLETDLEELKIQRVSGTNYSWLVHFYDTSSRPLELIKGIIIVVIINTLNIGKYGSLQFSYLFWSLI